MSDEDCMYDDDEEYDLVCIIHWYCGMRHGHKHNYFDVFTFV